MIHKYLVEFLGTMFLSFVVFSTGNYLAIGVALAIAILLGSDTSGGIFNPAMTITKMYSGHISRADLIPYIVAQIAGALAGFEFFKIIAKI
jgi:aquaporin Z